MNHRLWPRRVTRICYDLAETPPMGRQARIVCFWGLLGSFSLRPLCHGLRRGCRVGMWTLTARSIGTHVTGERRPTPSLASHLRALHGSSQSATSGEHITGPACVVSDVCGSRSFFDRDGGRDQTELLDAPQPVSHRPTGACHTATSSLPAGSLADSYGLSGLRWWLICAGSPLVKARACLGSRCGLTWRRRRFGSGRSGSRVRLRLAVGGSERRR